MHTVHLPSRRVSRISGIRGVAPTGRFAGSCVVDGKWLLFGQASGSHKRDGDCTLFAFALKDHVWSEYKTKGAVPKKVSKMLVHKCNLYAVVSPKPY